MIEIAVNKILKAGHADVPLSVNLTATQGSITAIHGPSGAGKSTFLKIVAGLVKPETGRIAVNGITWLDTENRINLTPQQRQPGFVFQNYALFPNMTVREHLQYATKDNAWIAELLGIGKFESLQNRKPEYLSGGQQQRLAILRAMAIKPQVLLMDEPFSALDVQTKQELIGSLKQLWQQLQITVIVVTHQLDELKHIASQTILIG